MKVKCSQCNTAYAVDDAKVAGKKFGFDCPKCGASVVIDNRSPERAEIAFTHPATSVSAGKTSSAETVSSPDIAQHEDFDTNFSYHDEIEPEIDLSVLGTPGTPQEETSPDMSFDFSAGDSLSEAPAVQSSSSADEDESITIDLNSLDIDLAEPEEMAPASGSDLFAEQDDLESEKISIGTDMFAEVESPGAAAEDDDESITLDLDSLDIPLEESDGTVMEGISSDDEDVRLTLDDAGLTLDEVPVGSSLSHDTEEDESLHLTLDEIDDTINIEDINRFAQPAHSTQPSETELYSESDIERQYLSSLPEIDLDQYDAGPVSAFAPSAPPEDRFLDIESKSYSDDFYNYGDYYADQIAPSGGGYVDFSVDYALHYSRLKAVLRLFGIYFITFIPHFIVALVYSLITSIVNIFNHLIILFSGKRERDFSLMTEYSLRYGVSILASTLNVIEEKPAFAGRKNIDSQLQMNLVYPPEPSRILAFLRLTFAGIFIIMIPHILLLSVLSVGMVLISFISLIYTIFCGKWPSIMFDFMVRYLRYCSSVSAFMFGLIDTYPSFRFE